MARVDRCTCCDLPVESCGFALEQAQRREKAARTQRALEHRGVFEAQFPGRCALDGTPFVKRDPIYRTEDGYAGALCCPPDDDG